MLTLFTTATVMATQGGAPAAAQDAAARITATGCVERADQLMGPGANPLGTTVDSLDFALIRATIAGADKRAVGTSGDASPTPQSGAAASAQAGGSAPLGQVFRLDATPEMLTSHVGHRVELVATRRAGAPAGGTADGTTPVLANAPVLHVESVKMVSETCGR
jgi:hypothetical protein